MSVNATGELYPGAPAQPLNLSLTNRTGHRISITSLTISLESVSPAAHPRAPGTCTTNDFEIRQLSGSLPVALDAGRSQTLAELGFAAGQLPEIAMVNQPYNQDGCQGATVHLAYGGTVAG